LKHGAIYNVEILSGLPAGTGEQMREKFTTRIVVPDRKPQIRFSGTGYVLPRQDTAGLPVTTINVDKVKLRLLRVNERNLVPSIDAERLTMSFSSYEVDEIINRTGSLVWQGEMAIPGERNRTVPTALPLKDMLHEKGPGIYLAVAERTDLMQDQYAEPATNWVLVSDIGFAALQGTAGGGGGCPLARRRKADDGCHCPPLCPQQRRTRRGDERCRGDREISGRIAA